MLWYQGSVLEDGRAIFDLSDRGLLLGDGLFETMVVCNHRVFRRDPHLDRLMAGAALLRLPADRAALVAPIQALAARMPGGTGVIRLTVTRGPGPRGLRLPPHPTPTIFAAAAAWQSGRTLGEVSLAVASCRRNPHSPLSRLKSLAYLDNILALEEARDRGADDALLLNTEGRVACASAANLCIIKDGALLTPPDSDGVLPGITRDAVLALAPRLGLQPRQASLQPGDLHAAEAVFLTNSVALVTLVTRLDGATLSGRARALVDTLRVELLTEMERLPSGARSDR